MFDLKQFCCMSVHTSEEFKHDTFTVEKTSRSVFLNLIIRYCKFFERLQNLLIKINSFLH